jgi:two-component system sensor histidine kinase KdpD
MALLVHDLRAPIARIQAARDYIAEDHPPPEMLAKALAIIDASVRALDRMTHNLLTLDRDEDATLRLAPSLVDLHAMCSSVAARANDMAVIVNPDARVEVTLGCASPRVHIDADLVQRAVENLVEDALRYGGRHGPVRLEIGCDASRLWIAVADNGPPISRAEDDASARRSHGLGLPFCEVVARAHGGSLRVESPETGARVVIELPRAAAPEPVL